ncbi:MAG TPA: hypothetical protein VFK57_21820 [Vicinamibacterales bacterium]|nr:hypothetical protein [Vicinamibacterales bacterium]
MSATFAALVFSALTPAAPPATRDVTARFHLDTTVTTMTARVGDPVPMRVVEAFAIDGITIPAGSPARGVVVDAVRPGRIRGRGALAVQIVSIARPDGTALRVGGTIFALPPSPPRRLPADVEGEIVIGMAAGYVTAALVSKRTSSAETIAGAGVVAGVVSGIVAGVLKRGEDLVLFRGAIIDVTLTRSPSVPDLSETGRPRARALLRPVR